MSLTRKVTLIVTLVFLVSVLANLGIQQIFIMPSFIAMEKETANKNTERVMGAIERELDQIAPSVSDWAYWTDTYDYVKGENPEYAQENLDVGNTLEGMNINFLGIFDTSGKTVWSQGVNLDSGDIIDLGEITETALPLSHPLLQHKNLESEVKGIINTPLAAMLIVAKPILTNDRKGPIVGTIMMGRFLDNAAVQRIGEQTKLPVSVLKIDQPIIPANRPGIKNDYRELRHSDFEWLETPERWQVTTTLADIFGNPILRFQIDTSRNISAQGAKAVYQSLYMLVATGMLMMLVLWKLLQQAILQPIAKLTEHAERIGEDSNLLVHLDLERKDEIGVLAHTFNQMVDHLAETRRRLIDQSYHSGIAEMASGVLHNIGNAITPLNIRLLTLQKELATAPLAEMKMATTELADPATPPERHADLVQFMALAGEEMTGLIQDSQEKVEASIRQIGHIQEIVTDQQRFSSSARVIEPVDMVTVITDVVSGLSLETKELLRIEITPSVAETGNIAGSRAALQQVVTNLLINAAESIQSAGTTPGRVTVTAAHEVLNGQSMVNLCFTDNGAGIAPDHLGRLFERGFSTKNREGSGYGLHWSANTMQTLGGRISFENVENGSGACVHMLLPLADKLSPNTAAADEDHDGLPN